MTESVGTQEADDGQVLPVRLGMGPRLGQAMATRVPRLAVAPVALFLRLATISPLRRIRWLVVVSRTAAAHLQPSAAARLEFVSAVL